MNDVDGSPVRVEGIVGVLEADPTGHRLHYLRHLHEAIGPDLCIVLTSDRALRSEEYGAYAESLTASTVVLPDSGSRRALLAAAVFRARTSDARRLVVPEGDFYLLPALLLMIRHPRLPLELRLLLMRTTTIGGPERIRPAMIIKPFLVRLLRVFPQVRVLFLTDALGVVSRRRGYAGVQAVKDPVLRTEASDHHRPSWLPPADPSATLVGVFGVISARKNLLLLVGAVARIPQAVLVVGGRLEPEVRAFVDTDDEARTLVITGRMVVLDRLLDPEEFGAGLATVDLVAVLHDNDAPSGILAEACIRHTPVLVPSGGWLAQVVETTGVGRSTPLTVPDVAEGILQVNRDRRVHVEAARREAPRINTTDFTDRLLAI